jgi:NitT/TauT family transport system permease protein
VNRWLWPSVSLLLLAAIWWLAAHFGGLRNLPPPEEVAFVMADEAVKGELFRHIGATLARVAAAFVLAMGIGMAIGIALGRSGLLNRFFDPWLIFALNMPALVTIVLCYVWFGLTEAAAVAAVAINKIPNVAVTIREGTRALDPGFDEVAQVFRIGWPARIAAIVYPQLEPYIAAAVRSGLALIWKIVLVVELLGRSNGVGFQIQLYFQNFDIARILAYALAFIAVVQVIEWVMIRPWERHARRWRLEAADAH